MRRASASSFSYPLAGILFAGLEACLTSCETCAGGLEACLTGFEVCIGGLEACLTGVEIALTGLAASGLAIGFCSRGLTDSISLVRFFTGREEAPVLASLSCHGCQSQNGYQDKF